MCYFFQKLVAVLHMLFCLLRASRPRLCQSFEQSGLDRLQLNSFQWKSNSIFAGGQRPELKDKMFDFNRTQTTKKYMTAYKYWLKLDRNNFLPSLYFTAVNRPGFNKLFERPSGEQTYVCIQVNVKARQQSIVDSISYPSIFPFANRCKEVDELCGTQLQLVPYTLELCS